MLNSYRDSGIQAQESWLITGLSDSSMEFRGSGTAFVFLSTLLYTLLPVLFPEGEKKTLGIEVKNEVVHSY